MKTVLIIEDNLEIRENTAQILELAGFKVINAENGKAGLAAAAQVKPDVILCDIMMPQVNGYEVIRELKKDPATATIPFIYVTASGEKKEVEKAMGLGANGYVRKPFDTKELLLAIERCSGASHG
ncbi:MAG TPA: response regulator [Chryseosolibacter sp.]